MRFRGKSIRRKIVALLLVPLLSLTVVWAFATVITGRQAARLLATSSVTEQVARPTGDTVRVLQQERRRTLVHLAGPGDSGALTALRRSRAATDEAVAQLRRDARNPEVRDALGTGGAGRLTAAIDALNGLDDLRRSVDDRAVDRAQALDLYNRLVDPCFDLLAGLHVTDDARLAREYHALVDLGRARELLSREDAVLGSALVTGTLTRDESRAVAELVAQRSLLYDVSLPLLPASERERYQRFWADASSAPVRAAEQAAAKAGSGPPRGVTAKSWDAAAANALGDLSALGEQSADRYEDRVRPVETRIVLKAAVSGVLGLLTLLLSLLVSVRIGRDLIRDLKQLRAQAHEAASVRLPGVMRRLSAGEQVDVATEVPQLTYDRNEIGEVAQAVDTLHRAAVEAAAKQAELRVGLSQVFVNLARRSQVLLHRQLALLDAMERRTEDTEELADLFRLDHLTTRMRRHAEGLVILSGAAPTRQWRRPVQLMDVVRAAVAEVEDYERVEVRRLPRVAVTGPAVGDLTHLLAELLENATVFSPPHTAVQVLGERVPSGFGLKIHDRGLGMPPEALLEANLRLAETPEFEPSQTDRLGLFVVSRLARRQNVRVSLQPSPYGGITAVVLIPDTLLTDDVPDTNGVGFRLDRPRISGKKEPEDRRGTERAEVPARLPRLPEEPGQPGDAEAPSGADAEEQAPAAPGERDAAAGSFRPRPAPARPRTDTKDTGNDGDEAPGRPVPLPRRRRTPKLVSSHGRPVAEQPTPSGREPGDAPRSPGDSGTEPAPLPALPRRRRSTSAGAPEGPSRATPGERDQPAAPATAGSGPARTPAAEDGEPAARPLPRRVRQASLAKRLQQTPQRRTARQADPAERDAEQVRARMASLQRGWQRGRQENATGDDARDDSTAPGTTKGDGR
ncbi:sensor histidine kinase [Streptomyces thermodiastaticus]|jgi:hypothetical protein|uniref:sensor histidine kinase n=1 Tax=Streptomyces thermodiastaticus TaxID=44061 RepID=UPI001673B018|nr:nitrate- and nitrite sensing domain-containing protein [Streptomyces thermodiastaticus]MCE7553098.1 nitrate- and nitrite sensing domain-containing protein [Streptomyces thermodiastaticus]